MGERGEQTKSSKKGIWLTALVLPLVVGLVVLVVEKTAFKDQPSTAASPTPAVALNNSPISAGRDANTAGRDLTVDNSVKQIMQGIDERDLRLWLEKLAAKDKEGREEEVRRWYEQKLIPANLREALLLVVGRIDQELRASQEEIKKLRQAGQNDLAEMLERLNRAFAGGIGQLDRERQAVLAGLDQQERQVKETRLAVLLSTAEKYHTALQYHQAIADYEAALQIKLDLGDEDQELGFIYIGLGGLEGDIANYDQAIDWLEKARKVSENVLGLEHPDTATSYNNLGLAWANKGDYGQAIALHKKACNIYEKVLGPNHPFTATSYNSLGSAWRAKGDFDQAVTWHEKARKIREKVLGLNHPSTATTYNNLGFVWLAKGEKDQAIAWFEKARKIDEKFWGLGHLSTATIYHNLGTAWQAKGNYTKALEHERRALAVLENNLPASHPNIAIVRENVSALEARLAR